MTKLHNFSEDTATEEALNAAQVVFSMNPMIAPQLAHFWGAQDQLLKDAETFTAAWFNRRHAAARAAFDTVSQLGSGDVKNPRNAMDVIAKWHKMSLERLSEDAKDYTDMVTRCVGCVVNNEIEATKEAAENYKRATTHTAIPV